MCTCLCSSRDCPLKSMLKRLFNSGCGSGCETAAAMQAHLADVKLNLAAAAKPQHVDAKHSLPIGPLEADVKYAGR